MNKLIIYGSIVMGLFFTGFYTGVRFEVGKQAIQQLRVTAAVIKDSNEDKIAIAKHITKTNVTKAEATRVITKIKIEKEYIVGKCHLTDITELRNKIITSYPASVFVQ